MKGLGSLRIPGFSVVAAGRRGGDIDGAAASELSKSMPPSAPRAAKDHKPPCQGPEAEAARAARLAKEAEALRANLGKRKAQSRARKNPGAPSPSATAD